jgi:hypothetical protein
MELVQGQEVTDTRYPGESSLPNLFHRVAERGRLDEVVLQLLELEVTSHAKSNQVRFIPKLDVLEMSSFRFELPFVGAVCPTPSTFSIGMSLICVVKGRSDASGTDDIPLHVFARLRQLGTNPRLSVHFDSEMNCFSHSTSSLSLHWSVRKQRQKQDAV